MGFDHLLLTAFNLRIAGEPGLSDEWLAHRLRLFEEFCLPSVTDQTVRAFRWILFCDPLTPEPHRGRIDRLCADPRIRVRFVERIDECVVAAREEAAPDATHLISTTLDNDDAISRTFVQRVQEQFRGQEFEILNFPSGYRLELASGRLYRVSIRTNPFVSLVERNSSPRTIRGCGPHNLLGRRFADIRDVSSEPLWLQVVHDRNLAVTGVWGGRRVTATSLSDRFTLRRTAPVGDESPWSIRRENLRRAAERAGMGLLSPGLRGALRRRLRRLRGRE